MKTDSFEVKDVVLTGGEMFTPITDEEFRELSLNDGAEVLVKVKNLENFFKKLYNQWEPLLRGRMDAARTDVTQINQVAVSGGFKLHLGAGKEDQNLSQSETESFWEQFLAIDPQGAKACFEEVHKIKKAEITKLRKIRGEENTMEHKRSELIERVYNPQPKKLEIKEA